MWRQREDHPGDQVAVECIFGHKALNAPKRRTTLGRGVERTGQFLEADRLHTTQRADKQAEELDSGGVHSPAEGLIENREQFTLQGVPLAFGV